MEFGILEYKSTSYPKKKLLLKKDHVFLHFFFPSKQSLRV